MLPVQSREAQPHFPVCHHAPALCDESLPGLLSLCNRISVGQLFAAGAGWYLAEVLPSEVELRGQLAAAAQHHLQAQDSQEPAHHSICSAHAERMGDLVVTGAAGFAVQGLHVPAR